MSRRLKLLVLAITGAALFVVPTGAAAGEWKIDCPDGKATCKFTTTGGHSEWHVAESPNMTCTSTTGAGVVNEGGSTETIEFTFKGCSGLFGSCNSTGAASGEVRFGASVFHNIYLNDSKGAPLGMLFTFPTITLNCFGLPFDLTGSVIAELTQGCNVESGAFNVGFTDSPENAKTQKWEQITKTGPIFDLHGHLEGSAATKTVPLIALSTMNFAGKAKTTCV